jgi:hypothetical protein
VFYASGAFEAQLASALPVDALFDAVQQRGIGVWLVSEVRDNLVMSMGGVVLGVVPLG